VAAKRDGRDVVQADVRVLPVPARLTALHPGIVTPSLVNATGPVGAVPVTDAVNVTPVPATAGLPDVAIVVADTVLTVCDNATLRPLSVGTARLGSQRASISVSR